MHASFQKRAAKQIKTFWLFSCLAVILLLGFAVAQTNSYIHKNSLILDYQKQIAKISSQNDILEINLSQANSVGNFDNYVKNQEANFEKVEVASVRYVNAFSGQLANQYFLPHF